MNSATIEGQLDSWLQYPDGDLSQHSLAKAVAKLTKKSREAESLSDKLALSFKTARERKAFDPLHYPKSGTEEEKEEWGARESRLWIEKVKPIYIEDSNWSITVRAFKEAKKDSGESNLNFMTRLKGIWDTMIDNCSREKAAVIPHGLQDEPGLVAHAITLMETLMMKEIFYERARNGDPSMIKVYDEFTEEVTKHGQRSRAVEAMLGTSHSPRPAPAHTPPPALGAGRGLGGAGRGRGRGRGDAIRQIASGRGRGGGGQSATAPPQDGARTPGQGDDGKPRHIKDAMPHVIWKSPSYGSCRMPPKCPNGKFPCVLKYYGMNCGRCDKPLPNCMFRDQKREQDPAILQETRDDDPHYQEFEEALKKLGGDWAGQWLHGTNTRSIRSTSTASGGPTRKRRHDCVGAKDGRAHTNSESAGEPE